MTTTIQQAIDKYIKLETEVAKQFMERYVEPIELVANPEKLMGRPFETWSPQDHMFLRTVYGKEPNAYSELVLTKEIQEVQALNEETGGM